MAKPWGKLEIGYMDHPKFLDLNGNAIALWHEAHDYCHIYDTGGLIPRAAPLEVEHIVPKARGDSDHESNLTVACAPCNRRKRTKTAAEFGFPHIHEKAMRIQ